MRWTLTSSNRISPAPKLQLHLHGIIFTPTIQHTHSHTLTHWLSNRHRSSHIYIYIYRYHTYIQYIDKWTTIFIWKDQYRIAVDQKQNQNDNKNENENQKLVANWICLLAANIYLLANTHFLSIYLFESTSS